MPVPLGIVDQSSLIIILNQCEGSNWGHDPCLIQCASDGANGTDDCAPAYDGRNGGIRVGRPQCDETLAALIGIMENE